jgi:hypothetical protein
MNEDTVKLDARHDVTAFVAAVRSRLADLTEEEREELLGGLEADLSERLAEGETEPGAGLGDPVVYAAELRAAAGLEARPRPWGGRRAAGPRPQLGAQVTDLLAGARRRWEVLVADGRPASVWAFLVTLRPLWWFFRAWVAAQLLDIVTNGSDLPTIVPTLLGLWPGVLVTVAFTLVSVQIGRGKWWPGSGVTRSPGARVLLLGLNLFAVVTAPLVLGQFPGAGTYLDEGGGYSVPARGIQDRGMYVTNVFPYDAQGKPLTGVQLFDQDGRPLVVGRDARFQYGETRVTAAYPWSNGGQRLWNVFPLPGRTTRAELGEASSDDRAWTSANPPVLPTAPLAVVPPAALPTPTAAEPQATPSASPSADSEKPRRR